MQNNMLGAASLVLAMGIDVNFVLDVTSLIMQLLEKWSEHHISFKFIFKLFGYHHYIFCITAFQVWPLHMFWNTFILPKLDCLPEMNLTLFPAAKIFFFFHF